MIRWGACSPPKQMMMRDRMVFDEPLKAARVRLHHAAGWGIRSP